MPAIIGIIPAVGIFVVGCIIAAVVSACTHEEKQEPPDTEKTPEPKEAGSTEAPVPTSTSSYRLNEGLSIKDIIQRLDRLDGMQDGMYTDHSLHISNATGVCEAAQEVSKHLEDASCEFEFRTKMDVGCGNFIDVDCKKLAQKLDVLIKIANRMPAFRFMAKSNAKKDLNNPPTREDFYGYHIVDHMIVSLLIGSNSADYSFQKLFSLTPFSVYTDSVHTFGAMLGRPEFESMSITDVYDAYMLFEGLGKKYKFDTTPFEPQPKGTIRL